METRDTRDTRDTPTPTTPESANREQRRAWDGDEGAYWAQHADLFDASVRRHHPHLLAAAGLSPGDDVLDVGCGAGQVALDAARAVGSGRVLGVDLSTALLDVARRRARLAGLDRVGFTRADAQVHAFGPATFDVVVSRTGAMFFDDPVAAFTNLARATRPRGRLALLVWQAPDVNEWFTTFTTVLAAGRDLPAPPPGAPGPFSLADPERARSVLEHAGWSDVALTGHREPMFFGPDAGTATAFIGGLLHWMLHGLSEPQRRAATDRLAEAMRRHQTPDGVAYASASWVVTARHAA